MTALSNLRSRAFACDALVFVTGLLLSGPMRRWLETGTAGFAQNDSSRSVVLGWVLGGAIAGYTVGCWLKRGPLQARMTPIGDSSGCILVAWVALMLSLTILGATIVFVELDLSADNGWNMLLLLALALTPVVLGARAMVAGDIDGLPAWRRGRAIELLADILIVASILPAALLWQGWISGLFTQNLEGEGVGVRLFAAGMATAGFAVFYFAPRLVLVYERIAERATWIWFAVAAAPVLKACLVP